MTFPTTSLFTLLVCSTLSLSHVCLVWVDQDYPILCFCTMLTQQGPIFDWPLDITVVNTIKNN